LEKIVVIDQESDSPLLNENDQAMTPCPAQAPVLWERLLIVFKAEKTKGKDDGFIWMYISKMIEWVQKRTFGY
jgi:hypothetical protein